MVEGSLIFNDNDEADGDNDVTEPWGEDDAEDDAEEGVGEDSETDDLADKYEPRRGVLFPGEISGKLDDLDVNLADLNLDS